MLQCIKIKLYFLIILSLFTSCSNDGLFADTPFDDFKGEVPVEFDCLLPNTRKFDDEDVVKTAFQNGDMIHVLGTFKTKYLKENGTEGDEYEYGELSRYGALVYNNGKWNAVAGSELTWPSIALTGTFQAYYIHGSNGVLTNDKPTYTYKLSDLTPSTDPLKATSDDDIVYGHAVKLHFNHICTHLTLVDLEPMVATKYWFYRPTSNPDNDDTSVFNNAFRLSLDKSEGQPNLKFEFFPETDPQFKNLVYIATQAIETSTTDESGNEKVITKARYFLEPGYYETFSLCYPATAPDVYEYLKYDYNNIPENVGGIDEKNTPPNLEAGTTYTLNITKSPGVTVVTPPPSGGWDESDEYYDVDVEKFLQAVYDGDNYQNDKGIQILEKTANGTKLLHNVNFNYFHYGEIQNKEFRPNIQEGKVFDGDYHYIQYLGSPLFRYNSGTIQNVGIKHIRIDTAISYEDDDENNDMSRHGALCMWNRSNATIHNVRVDDVTMIVKVKSYIKTGEDGSETHNIGCVIGSNTGKISEIALKGAFSLQVVGYEEEGSASANFPVNASVLIGGIVGQNAGMGEIYDVSPLEDNLTIRITNECQGDLGSYSIGGAAGESTAILTGIILSNVTIDSSKSQGVTSYVGGIVGQLNVSEDLTSTASINSCIVSGSITSGITVPYRDLTSGSYIGGIAGADLGVPVIDCRTAVSVDGSIKAQEGVIYATGGAFGRIREASTYRFENLIAYGSALKAPSNSAIPTITSYVGNFAGIVPQAWDINYADKNIIIHTFDGIENIGAKLDSNNKE